MWRRGIYEKEAVGCWCISPTYHRLTQTHTKEEGVITYLPHTSAVQEVIT